MRLVFDLALAMGRPAAWVLGNVSAVEFDYWAAYSAHSPFGPRQADYRAGVVAAAVANAFAGKGAKPVAPSDFFPHLKVAPARGSGLAQFRAWATANDPSKTPIPINDTRFGGGRRRSAR